MDEIIKDYFDIKSVWKVGLKHGITGQKVYSILKKKGVDTCSKNKWTDSQIKEIYEIYNSNFLYGTDILDDFCKKHEKLKSNVCRKAKLLGLNTDRNRKFSDDFKKEVGKRTKEYILQNGHPKGMFGKKHTDNTKKIVGEYSKKMWENKDSKVNSKKHRQELSDRMSKNMTERMKNKPNSIYSNAKKGIVYVADKRIYARSSWEANIAAYFQFLKETKEIKDWFHEPETFWFNKIKRGVRSYLPDFKIINNDDSFYFVEVKGYMDAKSKTKINRMRIYYPKIELRLIKQKEYKEVGLNKDKYIYWGLLD